MEISTVYCEKVHYGLNAQVYNVKATGIYNYHRALKD
jgi:hypothetical protein